MLKQRLPYPKNLRCSESGMGLWNCISNKYPGLETTLRTAAGLETTLRTAALKDVESYRIHTVIHFMLDVLNYPRLTWPLGDFN